MISVGSLGMRLSLCHQFHSVGGSYIEDSVCIVANCGTTTPGECPTQVKEYSISFTSISYQYIGISCQV